jgi:hypothetical protein
MEQEQLTSRAREPEQVTVDKPLLKNVISRDGQYDLPEHHGGREHHPEKTTQAAPTITPSPLDACNGTILLKVTRADLFGRSTVKKNPWRLIQNSNSR